MGQGFFEITLACSVSKINTFYTEIQDGCQKWWENDFCDKSPIESAETLRIKNFGEITLALSVSKINSFLHFMKKFKIASKSVSRKILAKTCQ